MRGIAGARLVCCLRGTFRFGGRGLSSASRTNRRWTLNICAIPLTVPTPHRYSRRILVYRSILPFMFIQILPFGRFNSWRLRSQFSSCGKSCATAGSARSLDGTPGWSRNPQQPLNQQGAPAGHVPPFERSCDLEIGFLDSVPRGGCVR
jgi:hypothetical protein